MPEQRIHVFRLMEFWLQREHPLGAMHVCEVGSFVELAFEETLVPHTDEHGLL
jgi:hypothetical protein